MYTLFPTIVNRKIKIAVVGCGRIAQNHFSAIADYPADLELTDICDIDAQTLNETVKGLQVNRFLSLEEMLEQSSADVVSIATPSGLHAEQAILVAKNQKHVISEKPMATRWGDALKMVKACDDAKVRLFIVKQNRHNQTLQLLKEAIDQGRFGQIYMVNINVFWTRPQSYYDAASWRGTWEFDGGAFMNQASHYVDLLEWLIGPIDKIHAFTSTLARKIEAEDTGVVNVKWRAGALGSINVTMLTYPRNLEGSITIIGETGTVKVGGVAVNEIQHWEFLDTHPNDQKVKEANYQTTSVYGFGHPLYYKNVINVLRGQSEPLTDGREGLKSLEILTAIYRSSRDNVPVSLPLSL